MNKRNLKNDNGITLVALVLTIVVMIILAGISINAIVGDNGVLAQAQNAKIRHEDESTKEQIELAWTARMSKFYEDLAEGKTTYDRIGEYFDQEQLNQMFGGNGQITGIERTASRI